MFPQTFPDSTGSFPAVSSIKERLLGRPVAAADVTRRLSEIMCAVFGATPVHIAPETINARIAHLDPGSLQTSVA